MPHIMSLSVAAASEAELIDAHEDLVRELESADNPAVVRLREQIAHNLRVLKNGDALTGTRMTPEQLAESQAIKREAIQRGLSISDVRRQREDYAAQATPDSQTVSSSGGSDKGR